MNHPHHDSVLAPSTLRFAVLTCSDSRTPSSDRSGPFIVDALTEAGYGNITLQIVTDDPDQIRAEVLKETNAGTDFILLTGGTGISPRDNSNDVISTLIQKALPGFGELFRMLSYDEIGAASMLSRAQAGLRDRSFIFSLPGSTGAVKLAMTRLILPEIMHLATELRRPRQV